MGFSASLLQSNRKKVTKKRKKCENKERLNADVLLPPPPDSLPEPPASFFPRQAKRLLGHVGIPFIFGKNLSKGVLRTFFHYSGHDHVSILNGILYFRNPVLVFSSILHIPRPCQEVHGTIIRISRTGRSRREVEGEQTIT
jgi:hypothetical protein